MPHIVNPELDITEKVVEKIIEKVVEKPVYQTRLKTVTEVRYVTRTVHNPINWILLCVTALSLLSHLL